MNLTGPEKALMVDLARNPVFTSLMQRIEDDNQIPEWKKGGDETAKHHEWIHRSGFVKGITYMLKLLRKEND